MCTSTVKKKACYRVKDRELEESEERHQAEIKVYKQKVKHLLYEQEQNLAELRAENMVSRLILVQEEGGREGGRGQGEGEGTLTNSRTFSR